MSTVGQSAIIRSLSIRPLFSFIGKNKGEINISVTVQVHVHTLLPVQQFTILKLRHLQITVSPTTLIS